LVSYWRRFFLCKVATQIPANKENETPLGQIAPLLVGLWVDLNVYKNSALIL